MERGGRRPSRGQFQSIFFAGSFTPIRFWGFSKNLGGFLVFPEIFGLGFVKLSLYAHALHSHCILTMFHAFRCVFDIVDCVLVGLDWVLPMMTLHGIQSA